MQFTSESIKIENQSTRGGVANAKQKYPVDTIIIRCSNPYISVIRETCLKYGR